MHINLDPWQKEFIKAEGNKILCTGRQVGKSEVCSIDAIEWIMKNPGSKPVVMIAPTERQAYGLFSKTLNYLTENYGKSIMKGKNRPTQTRIKLKIGKTINEIYCLPVGATGLGIRFLTIGRLYVDEASRLPEMVWEAVLPSLVTTGGDLIVLSTPFGAQGTFYDIWRNKNASYDDFSRFSVTTETVMQEREVCKSWTEYQKEKAILYLDSAKKRFSKRQYAQEYVGEFIEDLHRWFNDDLIFQTCTLKRPEQWSKRTKYYMGVDIARMGEDRSTFQVFMKTPTQMIHVESITTEKKYTTETEAEIIRLTRKWDCEKVYIDAGSGTLGVSIFDHLIQHDEMKRKIVAINNAERVIEYSSDGNPRMMKLKKVDLYDNLRALMEQRRIKLLDDDEIKQELASVQYEYVMKEGQPTTLRIFANPSADIVEGITRGAWAIKQKDINIRVYSIPI